MSAGKIFFRPSLTIEATDDEFGPVLAKGVIIENAEGNLEMRWQIVSDLYLSNDDLTELNKKLSSYDPNSKKLVYEEPTVNDNPASLTPEGGAS